MIKQICILTKSYKHGGFCVAGIDLNTKEWVRLVNSDNPDIDEIKKEQMFLNGEPIECLDVIECDFIKRIPHSCQTENWLLNNSFQPKYIKTITIEELMKIVKIEKDDYFIFNQSNLLSSFEISKINRSLYLYHVQNLKIEAISYEYYGEIRFKYKCSFIYNNIQYNNISLTDPTYRDIIQDGLNLEHALIIASLPCVPYKDNFYYKFVAKVIPVDPDKLVKNDGILKIFKEGFFYSVYKNDALLLNKIFGYKLFGVQVLRTGFPVKGRAAVLEKLDKLCINYDVYNYDKYPTISQRFENNNYEMIDITTYTPRDKSPKYEYFNIKRSDLLRLLAENINPITGESSNFIDPKTKIALLDIAKRIEKREKSDNGFKVKIIDN